MRIVQRKKKGASLLEIIISIAILAVISIPLSGMIITTVKTSKSSEDKQKASYIGQQILEEIRVKELDGNETELSNGLVLIKETKADGTNIYKTEDVNKEYSGFKIEVNLTEDKSIQFKDEIEEAEFDKEIDLSSSEGETNLLRIINDINDVIGIVSNGIRTDYTRSVRDKKGYIKINIKDELVLENIKIEVTNKLDNPISIYLDNSEIPTLKTNDIVIENIEGAIKRFNNSGSKVIEDNERMGTVFNIEVSITRDSKELFKGNGIKNILY